MAATCACNNPSALGSHIALASDSDDFSFDTSTNTTDCTSNTTEATAAKEVVFRFNVANVLANGITLSMAVLNLKLSANVTSIAAFVTVEDSVASGDCSDSMLTRKFSSVAVQWNLIDKTEGDSVATPNLASAFNTVLSKNTFTCPSFVAIRITLPSSENETLSFDAHTIASPQPTLALTGSCTHTGSPVSTMPTVFAILGGGVLVASVAAVLIATFV